MKPNKRSIATCTSQKLKYLQNSRKHRVALHKGTRALVNDAMELSVLTGTKIQIQIYNSKEKKLL